MKVQILVKNSKYGHDYEVVKADAFFNNKDLEEDYREKKQEEWHQQIKESGADVTEDDYVDWYGDMDPIQLQVQEELWTK